MCSKLVSPLQTQNRLSGRICMSKRQFLAYFGNFLALFESYLGHSGPAKLVSLDVLSAGLKTFNIVPSNRCSHMALILKMPIFPYVIRIILFKLDICPENTLVPKYIFFIFFKCTGRTSRSFVGPRYIKCVIET